jgi:hypothetical protein
MLEIKQRYETPPEVMSKRKRNKLLSWSPRSWGYEGFRERHFDITEDMSIDTYNGVVPPTDQNVVIPLLYSPLPADLPTVQKDLLILWAALHGDIDRYARLRRPYRIRKETECVVRGIYHSPMFAKWCSLQRDDERLNSSTVKAAINARFIMCNDLSRITTDTKREELPFCIWYPTFADPETYIALARRRPDMKVQTARACIVADYADAYREISPDFDRSLLREAEGSPNPFYAQDLQEKKPDGSVCDERYVSAVEEGYIEPWKFATIQRTRVHVQYPPEVQGRIEWHDVVTCFDDVYDGLEADFRSIEVAICASEEARQRAQEEDRRYQEEWTQQGYRGDPLANFEVPWIKC